MEFLKMHGLGNDFVIFDARKEPITLSQRKIKEISDRRRGIGCDLIAVIENSDSADVRTQFFNADGSESGACGNATRCIADLVLNDIGKDSCTIAVTDGILKCRRVGDLLIEVDMGAPRDVQDLDISFGGVSQPVTVDMGNPHCIFFVDDIEEVNLEIVGSYFESHETFPNRTNVEFVQVVDNKHVRQRTWERGCGITEACGSGACAVAVASLHRGWINNKVEVELDGGILHMEIRESDGHVLMSGPIAYVFDGNINSL